MKSKIEEASGDTCRRMILAPSHAALDWMLSMSLYSTVLQVLCSPSHVMRISLLCLCQALKLGLDTQLEDLDGLYRHGKLEPR
jgi:hypothetical protein